MIVLVAVMKNIIMCIQLVLAVTFDDKESFAKKASITRRKKEKKAWYNQ